MTKTPREILEKLYRTAVVQEQRNDSNTFTYDRVDTALADLKEAVLAAVGEDEVTKARPDKLRQSPPWQRNQLRASLRKAILTMFEGE